MNMHDDAQEPTPQDWGFPANPTRANQECWDRQEAFLEAYRHTSRLTHAARAVGVSIYAVDKWLSRDVYSFKKRMDMAHREYCDWVRGVIQERLVNPQGNRGSDILLMFESKAAMPELYREEVKVVGVDASKQMMDKLREMAARERKQLEAPAIEGEFKEVGEPSVGITSLTTPRQIEDLPRQVGGTETPPVMMPQSPEALARETNPSVKQPTAGRPKPGRYQHRGKPGRPFTRR
jgi:hypothetical protein